MCVWELKDAIVVPTSLMFILPEIDRYTKTPSPAKRKQLIPRSKQVRCEAQSLYGNLNPCSPWAACELEKFRGHEGSLEVIGFCEITRLREHFLEIEQN